MPNWFNQFLVKTVPLMPKFMVGLVARKYVAGKNLDAAEDCIRDLNKQAFWATADVLGENIRDIAETQKPLQLYLELIDRIAELQLDSGISLKLSQFGLGLDTKACWQNFEKVLQRAKSRNIFVRIDMEDSSLTDATLDCFRRARSLYARVGIVLQAALRRTEADLNSLLPLGADVRICKGIYKEAPEIVLQEREEIRQNFFHLVKILLSAGGYAAIATHDLEMIRMCDSYIQEHNIPATQYEYQALLGVPVLHTLQRLLDRGSHVRFYVPFGNDWYAYSMRRLRENPDIAGYIFKDFFRLKQT